MSTSSTSSTKPRSPLNCFFTCVELRPTSHRLLVPATSTSSRPLLVHTSKVDLAEVRLSWYCLQRLFWQKIVSGDWSQGDLWEHLQYLPIVADDISSFCVVISYHVNNFVLIIITLDYTSIFASYIGALFMISSHFTIEREMVWVERYLIDIYDKVPLLGLGAMAWFIHLVMPCAVVPLLQNTWERSKYAASCWYFSNTSDAHWGSAQCTEDEIEIFPEHEDLCDPLRTVQQCQKCDRWWRWPPTKMFFFWRLVVFSDRGENTPEFMEPDKHRRRQSIRLTCSALWIR